MTDAKKKRKFKIYYTKNRFVTRVAIMTTIPTTDKRMKELIEIELKNHKDSFAEVCE